MFTLKEETCIFLHMKTTTKIAFVPKSECTDEKVWEMGLGDLASSCSGPLGKIVLVVKQVNPHLLCKHLPSFTPAPTLHINA